MPKIKREKLVCVRISKKLYADILILNKLQAEQGNNYTVSDTINFVLQKTESEINQMQKINKSFAF